MKTDSGNAATSHVHRFFTVWFPSILIALYAGSITALAAAALSWAATGLAHGSRVMFLAIFAFGVPGALRVAWWMFRRALTAERALANFYARTRPSRPAGSGTTDPQL